MCLILVAWRAHPDYPLVVAANRDEFFARPTAAAAFWPDGDILAGRDLKEGGTWMGITRNGRFAALTNYRDPALVREGKASRGQLAASFLAATAEPMDWLAELSGRRDDYNPFNILVGHAGTLACLESTTGTVRQLEPGVHGLSNHLFNSPWPKVVAAKSALSDALAALPDDAPLLEMLEPFRQFPGWGDSGVRIKPARTVQGKARNGDGDGTQALCELLERFQVHPERMQ